MRWVALAIILASLPVFVALLSQKRAYRDYALAAMVTLIFFSGPIQTDAAIITWPMWAGTVKGIVIAPSDTLALALILTRRGRLNKLPFLGLIALYAMPPLISVALSGVPMASSFTIYQLMRVVLVFVAIGGELSRPTALRHVLVGLALGLMTEAGFVIYQKGTGMVQATGTLPHQNVLGLMTEMAVMPLIAAVFEGERKKVFYLGILSALIIGAGSGSRGTLLFMGLAIVIFAILSLVRRTTPLKMKLVGVGVLAGLIFAPLSLITLEDRFGKGSFITDEEQRAAFERSAQAIARDFPFGVGANMFTSVNNTGGYAAANGVAWNQANRAAPVHNAYLLARSETGWLGEFMLIALMVIPGVAGLRLAFRDRKLPALGIALGSAASIAAVAAHNNFEYAWFTEGPQRIFFINLAIIAGLIKVEQSVRDQKRKMAREAANAPAIQEPQPALGLVGVTGD